MNNSTPFRLLLVILIFATGGIAQDNLPPIRDTHKLEAEYYPMVDIPIPGTINLEAGSFLQLDKTIAIGTRRGDIYFLQGITQEQPKPQYRLFASGMHEVLGLAAKKGVIYATQQCEVTRISDSNKDGRADRFETINDGWGFGGEHEFTYGSGFDKNGHLWTVHCLTGSYTSQNKFRGWCLRTTADGKVIPTCSGIRSPGGIGMNSTGDMFYTENQGPWNGACSLKHLKPGGFLGHPISFHWYPFATNLGAAPQHPEGGRQHRQHLQAKKIPQLVPPSVVFPYKKMGQSASAIVLDESGGKFGPFTGQLFVSDYTLSLVMRVDLEQVNGVYQGACFPFREGFSTGIIGSILTKEGYFLAGGCSRGWPTRGTEPYALQRLHWSGKMPFEVVSMKVSNTGFDLEFTKPLAVNELDPGDFELLTYTHYYQPGYGSPEVDQTHPKVISVSVSNDGKKVKLVVDKLQIGHVHELKMTPLKSSSGDSLLHDTAYYTLNQIPK